MAALFAVHPLHVESVAWVTERKDVLSGLFFVLTLWTYVWYASGPFAPGRYLLLLAVFTLGLTAKPMLATLPFVLLLLDYWPLRRLADRSRFLCQPVLEKLPLLLLAAIFSSLTSWTMRGSLAINEHFPFWQRLANALVAYVSYLGQSVYPAGLAVFYPHPEGAVPAGQVLVAAAVLVLISVGAVAGRRRCPYLLVGWLWYLGMLVPVIGVVQLGWCARADRFTYLPQIGLAVALAWGAADLCRSWSPGRWACGVASALMLAALTACAWRQTCSWYDSETLWTHALACTSSNWMAHEKLGDVFLVQGHVAEAVAQYRKTLEIKPDCAESHVSLANALGL